MNWRTTWLMVGIAAALLAFILFVERRQENSATSLVNGRRLLDFKPEEIETIQLRRTNQLVARLDLTNGMWSMTVPLTYPARVIAVGELLQALDQLQAQTLISSEEIKKQGQTISDFGLDVPRASLTLLRGGNRMELMFGNRTTMGQGVYLQLLHEPGIFVVDERLMDMLPEDPNEWRAPELVNIRGFLWDRMEVKTPSSSYALQADITNQTFLLSQPTPARADIPKVEKLLRTIQSGRVLKFVDDNPRADLEPYGLQAPRAELVFALGTNDLEVLQFGGSPTNQTGAVYVRDMTYTNIMLVSMEVLDAIQTSHAELRENRLFTLNAPEVDGVEIRSVTNLFLRRQTDGGWGGEEAGSAFLADGRLMGLFFKLLGQLEGEVERNVATDFSTFGLADPGLQYLFFASKTNETGQGTNQLLLQLDFGKGQEEKVFVRRLDEPTVYSVSRLSYEQLPRDGWQLKSRQVWTFSTNDILGVRIVLPEKTVELTRTGPGAWELAPGSQGVINDFAVEETMYRLGNLKAEFWVSRGTQNRELYGFSDQGYRIEVILKGGDTPDVKTVEFGDAPENQFPFAMADVDGQVMIFEFPKKLHFEILRDLILPFLRK